MEIDTLTKISTDNALDALCYYLERIGEDAAFEAVQALQKLLTDADETLHMEGGYDIMKANRATLNNKISALYIDLADR